MNDHFARAPHRGPAAETSRHSAALLIDFDNVTMGIRSNMGQELRNFLDSDIIRGKVAVQRAYADWRRYPQYIVPLSEASIDLIFAPAYGSSKKNATDIRLAIDALELVFTRPEIETFILLSGDSDFSSLVLKLKEYGKYVIGVGLQESTSDILVQNCDEYYSYNRLSGLKSADEIETEKHDPWELTTRAVTRMAERGDVMRSDRLKQVMLEMDPGFDERTVGFSRFNRFLTEAAKRGGIVLQKRENGQYEVTPAGGAAPSAGGSAGREGRAATTGEGAPRSRSRRGRRGGSGRGRGRSTDSKPPPKAAAKSAPARPAAPKQTTDGLQAAYEALARAVRDLAPDGAAVRDSMAKRKLLEYDASFDEGSFGFSKFSLFLHAAHEAGVIRMARHEDGNHYLRPAADGRKPAAGKPAQKKPAEKEPQDGRGRSPFSAAAAAARKTLGRLRRGPDTREEEATKSAARSAAARQAPKDRGSKSAAGRGAGQRPRPQRKREERAPRTEQSRPQTPPEPKAPSPERKAAREERKPRPDQRKRRSAAETRKPAAETRKPAARTRKPAAETRKPAARDAEDPRRDPQACGRDAETRGGDWEAGREAERTCGRGAGGPQADARALSLGVSRAYGRPARNRNSRRPPNRTHLR